MHRSGSEALEQFGATRTTVTSGNSMLNSFANSTGAEMFFNAANSALSSSGLVTSSLNSEAFFYAKGFFMRHGAPEPTAITMALIALDAAKVMGVSVVRALEPLAGTTGLVLSFETYVTANIFRPASSKQTYLVAKQNSNSYRAREIMA